MSLAFFGIITIIVHFILPFGPFLDFFFPSPFPKKARGRTWVGEVPDAFALLSTQAQKLPEKKYKQAANKGDASHTLG